MDFYINLWFILLKSSKKFYLCNIRNFCQNKSRSSIRQALMIGSRSARMVVLVQESYWTFCLQIWFINSRDLASWRVAQIRSCHTCLSMMIKHLVTFLLIEKIKPNVVDFSSGESLIFIEVALVKDVAASIQVKVLNSSSLTL